MHAYMSLVTVMKWTLITNDIENDKHVIMLGNGRLRPHNEESYLISSTSLHCLHMCTIMEG